MLRATPQTSIFSSRHHCSLFASPTSGGGLLALLSSVLLPASKRNLTTGKTKVDCLGWRKPCINIHGDHLLLTTDKMWWGWWERLRQLRDVVRGNNQSVMWVMQVLSVAAAVYDSAAIRLWPWPCPGSGLTLALPWLWTWSWSDPRTAATEEPRSVSKYTQGSP